MFQQVAPWTEQPQEWADVDITSGLEVLYNAASGVGLNVRPTLPKKSAVFHSGRGALYESGGLADAYQAPLERPVTLASRFTFFAVARATSVLSVAPPIFGLRGSGGSATASVCFKVFGSSNFGFDIKSGGADTASTIPFPTDGVPVFCSVRYDGTNLIFNLGGAQSSVAKTITSATYDQIEILYKQAGPDLPAAGSGLLLGGYFGRCLTDAEIANLSANPWQLFVRREWVFSNVAAGGGTHVATGALASAGGAASGTAARTRAHPSSGALANSGGRTAGTARRLARHTATGTLVNPGATTAGAAARRVNHGGTGALANPGGSIAGTAARTGGAVTHPSSGALVNPGAQLAGTAARVNGPVTHPSTGTLANPGASLAGSATRTPAPVTHSASGALANPGGRVVGFATNESGALIDTHDGFWAKQYRKMWERKSPTIAEIVEKLEDEPQEVLQAIPEVRREVAREMGGRIDYEAITRNLELQRVIAKQIQIAIELRYAQRLAEIDEEDAEILLLI